ncbi:hypothetical protein M885DRAFT_612739 [Pelagophyceae sp. CCMP2097]|nr:hypothetical protein M885DRAFT_612739 [Pelagophyceae sp. CCMP2097]
MADSGAEEEARSEAAATKGELGPVKKALSAFFHFCADRRASLKSANAGATPTEMTKLLGEEWKSLTDAEKKPYADTAAADKVIPLARVKKICKLDPEVKSLSKEATALIGKAAEGFVQHLARQTLATASAKRTLRPSDIAHCVQHRADFAWLRADYPASEYAPEKKVAKRAALERPAKNATMTQFLKPAAPAVQEPDADDDEEEDE